MFLLLLCIAASLSAEKPAPQTKPPRLLSRVDPEYTEDARKARVRGSVLLAAQLDEGGRLHDIRVVRGLGYGLDEKAVECVRQWQFQPATRNGEPVGTRVNLDINFRLLN